MTTTLEALQTTLAGEHGAVWTFSVLGARTSRSAQPALAASIAASYLAHRSSRDQLVAQVRDLGVQPAASAVAYDLPNAALTVGQVTAAALLVERRCADGYADLVADVAGSPRRWAIAALTETAIRELGYRGSPEIFPGATELADH